MAGDRYSFANIPATWCACLARNADEPGNIKNGI
jgi:hypothetical protein